MSWVFLSDEAPGHHKILGLSDAAFRLWIVGLTYCGQQANDGRFSAHAARIICGYLASPELGKAAIAELVTARLWHATDAGYAIHDYLDYQQSKDSRAASNKAAAERMRAMRAARHGVTPPVREPLRCNTSVTSAELPTKFALPDPVPIPSRPDPGLNTDSLVNSGPSQPELALQPQQAADTSKASAKPSKAQIQAQVALGLFGELVAARMSVIAGAEQLQPRPAALAGLKACLGQDYTPDQIRHVIRLKVAEVKADPSQAKWFTPTWFRPGNVERYLALRPQDVTSARLSHASGYQGRPAPNEPPKSPRAGESDFQRQIRESRERGEIQ